jgi:hypothetical protein
MRIQQSFLLSIILKRILNLVATNPADGALTPFSALRAWTALANDAVDPLVESDLHWKLGEMGKTIMVKGHEITLKMIGNMVQRMVADGWSILKNDLFLGIGAPFENVFPSKLMKQTNGTNFAMISDAMGAMEDPQLGLHLYRNFFWNLSTQHPEFQSYFFPSLECPRLWNRDSVARWCVSFERLQDLLLVAGHLTGGMPPRASEVCSFNIRNGPSSKMGFFLNSNGLVGIVQSYHKMLATTHKSAGITRLLPELVGDILFAFLVFCRDVYM